MVSTRWSMAILQRHGDERHGWDALEELNVNPL
jgi:hypothetical protein